MDLSLIFWGIILIFLGLAIILKKLEIVKSGPPDKKSTPFVIINEDGSEELVFFVKIGFNIIGCGAIVLGFIAFLDGLFSVF